MTSDQITSRPYVRICAHFAFWNSAWFLCLRDFESERVKNISLALWKYYDSHVWREGTMTPHSSNLRAFTSFLKWRTPSLTWQLKLWEDSTHPLISWRIESTRKSLESTLRSPDIVFPCSAGPFHSCRTPPKKTALGLVAWSQLPSPLVTPPAVLWPYSDAYLSVSAKSES